MSTRLPGGQRLHHTAQARGTRTTPTRTGTCFGTSPPRHGPLGASFWTRTPTYVKSLIVRVTDLGDLSHYTPISFDFIPPEFCW